MIIDRSILVCLNISVTETKKNRKNVQKKGRARCLHKLVLSSSQLITQNFFLVYKKIVVLHFSLFKPFWQMLLHAQSSLQRFYSCFNLWENFKQQQICSKSCSSWSKLWSWLNHVLKKLEEKKVAQILLQVLWKFLPLHQKQFTKLVTCMQVIPNLFAIYWRYKFNWRKDAIELMFSIIMLSLDTGCSRQ